MTTRVWQRYGQLRIYVLAGDLAGDGEVGWCDPRSGRFALSRPERADEFWAAVAAECQRLQRDGRLGRPVLPAALAARLPASLVLCNQLPGARLQNYPSCRHQMLVGKCTYRRRCRGWHR